jgi:hypothetical protein
MLAWILYRPERTDGAGTKQEFQLEDHRLQRSSATSSKRNQLFTGATIIIGATIESGAPYLDSEMWAFALRANRFLPLAKTYPEPRMDRAGSLTNAPLQAPPEQEHHCQAPAKYKPIHPVSKTLHTFAGGGGMPSRQASHRSNMLNFQGCASLAHHKSAPR